MPFGGEGKTHEAVATKLVLHGDPVIEDGFVGVAFKSLAMPGTNPSTANVLAATQIQIGENFIIKMGGLKRIRAAKYLGGSTAAAAIGDDVYITAADNAITETASMNVYFGKVERKDANFVYVNMDARA